MSKKPQQDSIRKFSNLLHSFSQNASSDEKEAVEYLKEHGIDPEELIKKGMIEIRKHLFLAEAKKKKEKDVHLLKRVLEKIQEVKADYNSEKGLKLREILKKSAPSFQFRNLEKMDDDSIREILQEVNMLNLLEELDKEE